MPRMIFQPVRRTFRILNVGDLLAERFSGTAHYWEERYRRDGTSGMGSYGPFARAKAEFVNGYIRRHDIGSVVDFGVGDGNQLRLLQANRYVGLDVSPTAISKLRERFCGDSRKRFVLCNGAPMKGDTSLHAELGLSLDVIYHLTEDDTYERYLADLFHCAQRHVIVYSSDADRRSLVSRHVRDRNFTAFVRERFPDWRLEEVHRNPIRWLSRSDFFVYRKSGGDAVRDSSAPQERA